MRLVALVSLGLQLGACTAYSSLELSPADSMTAAGTASGGHGGSQAGSESSSPGGAVSTGGMSGGTTSAGGGGASDGGTSGSSAAAGAPPTSLSISVSVHQQVADVYHEARDASSLLQSDRCSASQVLIGFRATVDGPGEPQLLRSAQAVCGVITVSSEKPHEILITEAGTLPARGFPSAVPQEVLCPASHVVTSFEGHSGSAIDGVELGCSALAVMGSSPDLVLSIGTPKSAGIIGTRSSGGAFARLACEPGSLAVGQLIGSVEFPRFIETFGVLCSNATLRISL